MNQNTLQTSKNKREDWHYLRITSQIIHFI
jgi:hypothetical protein